MALEVIAAKELAHRHEDDLDVTLLWFGESDVAVQVVDHLDIEESFLVHVPSDEALDAFNHPFAYYAKASA